MTDIRSTDLGVAAAEPGFADYVALLKPRVMSLVVFTALVGLLVAPVPVHPVVGFAAIVFIALGAGASGALNMWWDADIDRIMKRTSRRPIPSGAVQPGEALGLGLGLSFLSVIMLGLAAVAALGTALRAGEALAWVHAADEASAARAIAAVQTAKKTFVNTFVTNETVKESMLDFIENQTEYTKKAFKATSDMATTVLAETTKAAQNAAKFDYAKFGEGIMKAYNQLQPKTK